LILTATVLLSACTAVSPLDYLGAPGLAIFIAIVGIYSALFSGLVTIVLFKYPPVVSINVFVATSILLAGIWPLLRFTESWRPYFVNLLWTGNVLKFAIPCTFVIWQGSIFAIVHFDQTKIVPLFLLAAALCGISFLTYEAFRMHELRGKIGTYVVAFILSYEVWLLYQETIRKLS
jgi:hypothetical protein